MTSSVTHLRPALLGSAALVLLLCTAGFALGFGSVPHDWARATLQDSDGATALSTTTILARNFSCALLLYSGVVTAGVTTLCGTVMVSVYVGATMAVGVVNTGWSSLIGDVGWYVPLEFAGLLLAAVAGLTAPAVGLVHGLRGSTGALPAGRAYLVGASYSLRLLALGAGLILLGALLEGVLIAQRH